MTFQRRLSKGLNFNANYTYSDASTGTRLSTNTTRPRRQWTPTNIPLPNRVNVTGLYELPFGQGRAC